ncbi:MAG: TatD family hydrolase [Propionibacteriaceae bacterium]|jgi:TatD DNase family protein|nr:TatD family hydrolase [Propionibacteriaceae bacterium]
MKMSVQAALAEIERLGLPVVPEPLPGTVIDSHTHMDVTRDISGLSVEANLAAAAAVGVTKCVQIGCDVESSRWAVGATEQYPQVIACVAIHPNDAARMNDVTLAEALSIIDELAARGGKVRGIGETGLDYFRTGSAEGRAQELVSFKAHIKITLAHGLTLAIHDRDAHADILAALDATGLPERIVMHCFSGDVAFAHECLDRGAWLSFPGVVTYKANQYLRDVLAMTPVERILVETDAPFLTPNPERGKRNAPYLVPHTVRFMADQLGLDLSDLCAQLRANTEAAYGGPWGDDGEARP